MTATVEQDPTLPVGPLRDFLTRHMTETGMTYRDISDIVNVPRSKIGEWMKKTKSVVLSDADKVTTALGSSLAEVYDYEEYKLL